MGQRLKYLKRTVLAKDQVRFLAPLSSGFQPPEIPVPGDLRVWRVSAHMTCVSHIGTHIKA